MIHLLTYTFNKTDKGVDTLPEEVRGYLRSYWFTDEVRNYSGKDYKTLVIEMPNNVTHDIVLPFIDRTTDGMYYKGSVDTDEIYMEVYRQPVRGHPEIINLSIIYIKNSTGRVLMEIHGRE